MLTWTEASRPRKMTIGVTNCAESDVDVENAQKLHLDLKEIKKRHYEKCCFD